MRTNFLKTNAKVAAVACFMGALLLGSSTLFAQVKIGDSPTTINAGSVLELQSTDKGLLMPRVSLTNTTTWNPPLIGTAVAGMHVYNTNAAITSTNTNYPTLDSKTGEYYWDGTGWVAIAREGTQNSPVQFSIKGVFSANLSTTPDKVDFASVDFDKNNNFDLAANRFVVPAYGAGYYQINASVITNQLTTGGGLVAYVFVNNLNRGLLVAANAAAGAGITAQGSAAVKLDAGDIVDVRVGANVTGVLPNYFSVNMYLNSK